MPISPEMARLPGIAGKFYRAGLLPELVGGMISGKSGRDMVEDAKRLIGELEKETSINIFGLENIPKETGCVILFNHPNMDVLLPAMLGMMIGAYDTSGQKIMLVMGSEIPMTIKNFNEKSALPGSVWLLNRFHRLYSENIISVPTAASRRDFLTGRTVAVRKIMRAIKNNNIVIISPEGHVEKNGVISPVETYHEGSGKLAILATRMGIPTVPVGIWETRNMTNVNIGRPFFLTAKEADLAAIEGMSEVAKMMPEVLRGPFY